MVVARGWGRKGYCLRRTEFQFCKIKIKFCRQVAQKYEYTEHKQAVHLEMVKMVHFLLYVFNYNENLKKQPWLVWLSGLSAGLRSKGSPVRFPVRAHAWVTARVPCGGHAGGNHTLLFLLSSPFPSVNK